MAAPRVSRENRYLLLDLAIPIEDVCRLRRVTIPEFRRNVRYRMLEIYHTK